MTPHAQWRLQLARQIAPVFEELYFRLCTFNIVSTCVDCAIQVHELLFLAAGMREVAHGLHATAAYQLPNWLTVSPRHDPGVADLVDNLVRQTSRCLASQP